MRQDYVLGFMFSENKDKVLLIRKNKPEYMQGLLNGIGGKIEKDELSIPAMVREFKEETGIETKNNDWNYFCLMQREDDFRVFCFWTIGDISKAKSMESEQVEIIDLLNNGIPIDVLYNLHWLIPLSLDNDKKYTEVNYKKLNNK